MHKSRRAVYREILHKRKYLIDRCRQSAVNSFAERDHGEPAIQLLSCDWITGLSCCSSTFSKDLWTLISPL